MKKDTTASAKNKSGETSSDASQSGSEQAGKSRSGSSGKSLMDVFLEELKDIYGAEKQLTKALPEMMNAASSQELKKTIGDHLEQTKGHSKRIEKVFALLGIDRDSKKCEAMEGLIEEGKEIIKDFDEGAVRDCALIIGAQKIEHYEIAAYGSLCELAEVMGKHQVAEILDETLEEEEMADMLLTEVAESVNDIAMESAK
jgi:ferritin-like metal-binding protein YciE